MHLRLILRTTALAALAAAFLLAGRGSSEADDSHVAADERITSPVAVAVSACNATNPCVYIRPGRRGNGSAWNNALGDIPTTLSRGATYFLADGTYNTAGRTFSAGIGTARITIKKATASDHGAATGWSSTYGDGYAVFSNSIVITADHFTLEGGDGRNLVVQGDDFATVISAENAVNLIVRNVIIDGKFAKSGAEPPYQHTGGACAGLKIKINSNNALIEGNLVQNIADDGIGLGSPKNTTIRRNTVTKLWNCGDDSPYCTGPCVNGHSEAIEAIQVVGANIRDNFLNHDAPGTTGVKFSATGTGSRDVDFVNNIVHVPNAGFAAYIQNMADARFYNNTFWADGTGSVASRYGGVALGGNVTGLKFYNNIVRSLNTDFLAKRRPPYVHDGNMVRFNNFDHRIPNGIPPDPGDVVGYPGFAGAGMAWNTRKLNSVPEDFELVSGAPGIDRGAPPMPGVDTPTMDYDGVSRANPPEMGAKER